MGTFRIGVAAIVAGTVLLWAPCRVAVDDGPRPHPAGVEPLPEGPVDNQGPRQAAVDCYGDPLPHGAIARLGTVRLSHTGSVFDLAFSPDGKTIASSCGDGCIHLWSVASGKEAGRLGRPGRVDRWGWDGSFVRFTPDGQTIVVTNDRHSVTELWSVAEQTSRRLGEDRIALRAVPSPDGKLVAEMTRDGFVRLWDLATGKELRRFPNQRGGIGPPAYALAFSPDGRYLAANDEHHTISVWDVDTGHAVGNWEAQEREVTALAFLPDGKRLLSAGWDKTIRLWEVETGKEVRRYLKGTGRMTALALHPDGKRFASSGEDDTIRLWDVESGRELRRFPAESYNTLPIAFSPDGTLLAAGGGDHRIRLWNVADGREVGPRTGPSPIINRLAFAPEGKTLLTDGWREGTLLWDAHTGREMGPFRMGTDRTWGFGLSAGGRSLATYVCPADDGSDKGIAVRQVPSGRLLTRFRTELPDESNILALSPDGRLVATCGKDATVQLWDVTEGRPVRTLGQHVKYQRLAWMGFSPDGKNFVARRNATVFVGFGMNPRPPGETMLWDTGSSQELPQFEPLKEWCEWLAFAPNGKTLVTNAKLSEKEVCLWDTATGKERRTFRLEERILTAAFSSDGQVLAAGCDDGDIVLWDPDTGEIVGRLMGHTGPVTALAFSADGALLASSSEDDTALVWDFREALRRPIPNVP